MQSNHGCSSAIPGLRACLVRCSCAGAIRLPDLSGHVITKVSNLQPIIYAYTILHYYKYSQKYMVEEKQGGPYCMLNVLICYAFKNGKCMKIQQPDTMCR